MPITSPLPSSAPASPALRLLPLAAIVLASFLAIGLPLPTLSLYVHGVQGFDTFTAGWVVGIQSAATLLTRPVAGNYCDRHGPRYSVMVGLPLAAVAGLIYLGSTFIPSRTVGLGVLVIGRLLMGLAESLFLTGTMIWGVARVGPQRTGMVIAWQGIAMFSAYGLGAPAGIATMQRWGFTGVSIITIVLPLLALAIALLLPRPHVPGHAHRSESIRDVIGIVWRPSLAMALGTMPFSLITAFLVLYYAQQHWEGAGVAVLAFTAGYIAIRLFLAHLPDTRGGRLVGLVSTAVQAAGLVVLWLAPTPAWALAGAVLTGVGLSLVFPAMGVEAMRHVPPERRGLAMACFLAFVDVSTGLTGPIAGALIELSGYGAAFGMSVLCCLGAIAIMLWGLGPRVAQGRPAVLR